MSRPANPLAKFRSYSYYHVLAICESSEAADALAKETKVDKWLHPTSNNPALGDSDTFGELGPFAVKYVDEQQKTSRYCILINGATDATFTIPRVKWVSATAAEATNMDQSTSIAIEGDLEISEPKGVVFMDVLVGCCLALGVDASNVVFVLKTFFVGHPDAADVSEEERYLSDIEPLRFIAYDITGTFAETGGLYQMAFVSLTHGASRLPQYGKAASGFNLTGGTLTQTFKNLERVVTKNYNVLFNCVTGTVKKQYGAQSDISNLLTRVNYSLSLDPVYQTADYKVTDSPQQVKDEVGCVSVSKVNIPANMSIEDAVHTIMKKCPKVTNEAAVGVKEGDGRVVHYEYKIHSGVHSERGDDGKLHYTIIYHVERFMRPKSASLFELAANADNTDLSLVPEDQVDRLSEGQQKLRKNLISFDYIYTGRNVDILEFEMKMNLGLAYLQIATINNSLKDQLQAVPTAVTHVYQYDQDKMTRLGRPTQIPVFFGTQIRMPSLRNKQDSSANAEAGYSLAKHSSIEVQDVTMRIYGNPRLVNSVNRTTSPSNIGKARPEQNNNNRSLQADYPDWGSFPAFAKVNIKMPRSNDDIALFRGADATNPERTGGSDFTRDFWFTGFYYVVGVEHVFDNGEFTQVLSMIGIPQNKAFATINKQGQNAQDTELQKGVLSCYDSAVDPCSKANQQDSDVQSAGSKVARHKECPDNDPKKAAQKKTCAQTPAAGAAGARS